MNKTNPIGVRFRLDILEKLKTDHKIDSPQKALVFLERFYVANHQLLKDVTTPLRLINPIPTETHVALINAENKDQYTFTHEDANAAILEQIKAIEAEKIPDARNKSVMGRKSWELDQQKRINELKKLLSE